MSWRTIVITSKCKLTYQNNYLVIKNEELNLIHLSEINTIVMDTTLVSITGILLCELMNRKIKIVICDERHNPKGELVPYYGSHNTSKRVLTQTKWINHVKDLVWQKIIEQKILNQANVLLKYEKENVDNLKEYARNVLAGDATNREGHSAKVYFSSLFGKDFTRDDSNDINSALDYGYSILLSNFNKEIVSNGYITQLGINHKNEFNNFNLSCDLMEPFRPLIDEIVYKNRNETFDKEYKYKLVNSLNQKVRINKGEYFLTNAIQMYTNSILKVLDNGILSNIDFVELK